MHTVAARLFSAFLPTCLGLFLISSCTGDQTWRTQAQDAATGGRPASGKQGVDAGRDVTAVVDAATDGPAVPADATDYTCGNGILDPGEECDDGDTTSGDGCSSRCQLECDWENCGPTLRIPTIICGNGILSGSEGCDDGNTVSGDGCSSICTVEPGWHCPASGKSCVPSCGDRVLKGTENCDDGNVVNGDGCGSTCLTEPGWDCTSGTCEPIARGDGGQDADGDYLRCGDGIVSGAEECDNGPQNDDSAYGGCNTQCRYILCGDGIKNGTEQCDLGPMNGLMSGKGGCTIGCTLPHYCGDGMVDTDRGEECDLGDSNGVSLDSAGKPSDGPDAIVQCGRDCRIPLIALH